MTSSAARVTLQCECPACGGTGLYAGFAEAQKEAVICLECQGSGASTVTYRPYTGRKRKRGIQVIRASRGTLLATGVGGQGPSLSYAAFEQQVKPAAVQR